MLRILLSSALMAGFTLPAVGDSHANDTKLIVIISVDQLRGDLLPRYADRFGPDGFRRLMEGGTYYTNAHYNHTTTYTGSGHATLATGGNPHEHGVIGNYWVNPETGASEYCVQDDDHVLLGASTRSGAGTSPENLLVETVGDALIDATEGKAKVFGFSRKDRSAILLGGHKGKAFWYDGGSGRFVTSDYYYDNYPEWVARWNAQNHADAYGDAVWDLIAPESNYVSKDRREGELGYPALGLTFPHSLKQLEGRALYGALSQTPFSDEMVVSLAKEAVEAEQLGRRDVTDLLAMGLSAADSIGHSWGPNSREQEDNLLRIDRLLEGFFSFLDAAVGEGAYIVALSADHGVDGLPDKGEMQYVSPATIQSTAQSALEAKFGEGHDYVARFSTPYLYLEPDVIAKRANEVAAMEDVAAGAIVQITGIAHAVPKHRIASGDLDDTPMMRRLQRSFHPDLSGNVAVIQEPYTHIWSGAPRMTATHGTPYAYDTHVPVAFWGPGVAAQTIERPTGPEAIAPTLARIFGLEPLNGAVGEVLPEVAERNEATE